MVLFFYKVTQKAFQIGKNHRFLSKIQPKFQTTGLPHAWVYCPKVNLALKCRHAAYNLRNFGGYRRLPCTVVL